MSSVQVVVDGRETTLQSHLNKLGVDHSTAELPVGDFRVSSDDGCFLCERKTLADWRASICDGRLYSQRERALCIAAETDHKVRFFYVLESSAPPCWNFSKSGGGGGLSANAVPSGLISCTFRDSVPVFLTASCEQTACLVKSLAAQLASGKLTTPRPGGVVAAQILGKRPREVLAGAKPLYRLLCAVPSVGHQAATALADRFESASALCAASAEEIASVPLRAGGGRCVGKALAGKVRAFF